MFQYSNYFDNDIKQIIYFLNPLVYMLRIMSNLLIIITQTDAVRKTTNQESLLGIFG